MEVQSFRTLTVSLFLAAGLLAFGTGAHAQPKPGADVTPAFKAKIEPLGGKLRNIEQRVDALVAKVNKRKLITEAEMEDAELDKAMKEYADAMKAAYDDAIKQAEQAARSKGKEGNTADLKAFEDLAKAHDKRMKQVEAKTRKVEAQIRTGAIRLDKSVLQKATPAEREEFRKHLKPEGIREMEKLHPDLFKPGKTSLLSPQLESESALFSAAAGYCAPLLGQLGDLLVSPAHAAIALPCVAPCAAKNWAACAACVVNAGGQAVEAYNSFVSCWNGSGKPWWTPRWLWRTWCVTKLVAKLA